MNFTRFLLNQQLRRLMSSSAQNASLIASATQEISSKEISNSGNPSRSLDEDDHLYRYLRVKCSCHETATLDSYEKFVKMAAENLEIPYVATESPFRTIKRRTLLACRFVKKKYRVQYEFRTYYRHLLFENLTGSTADTFLEYIERNLPEGVLLIAEKHRLAELPFDLLETEGRNAEQNKS